MPIGLRELPGMELPIIRAPMAGVQASALAIAVSNVGGLGSLPCAMLSLVAMRAELRRGGPSAVHCRRRRRDGARRCRCADRYSVPIVPRGDNERLLSCRTQKPKLPAYGADQSLHRAARPIGNSARPRWRVQANLCVFRDNWLAQMCKTVSKRYWARIGDLYSP